MNQVNFSSRGQRRRLQGGNALHSFREGSSFRGGSSFSWSPLLPSLSFLSFHAGCGATEGDGEGAGLAEAETPRYQGRNPHPPPVSSSVCAAVVRFPILSQRGVSQSSSVKPPVSQAWCVFVFFSVGGAEAKGKHERW